MTLIAAFRTKEGVAICADSQETVTDEKGHEYRKTVQKIAPLTVGQYQVAIAGSGDGELIDAFVELVERRIKGDTLAASIKHLSILIEDELDKFYLKHAIDFCDASMTLFVAACCPSEKQYEVWKSSKQYLRTLGDVELIGWGEELYWVTSKQLHRVQMSLTQAVLAAVHVLVIGEESSNYIKGPFSLTIVRDNGIWAEEANYVDTLRGRLKEFEVYTNQILLACADTSIYSYQLQQSIEKFALTARGIHEQQINVAVEKSMQQGFMNNDPLCKLPPGILVEIGSDGKLRVRHDVNGAEEMVRKINEAVARETEDKPDEN